MSVASEGMSQRDLLLAKPEAGTAECVLIRLW
jgi:hypothetical protein